LQQNQKKIESCVKLTKFSVHSTHNWNEPPTVQQRHDSTVVTCSNP